MPKLKPGHISPTDEEDAAINAAIASDPDTWEATGELHPVSPHIVEMTERFRKEREARKARGKTRVTIRLDADVVARLREDGPGWQTRANAALRQAVLGS